MAGGYRGICFLRKHSSLCLALALTVCAFPGVVWAQPAPEYRGALRDIVETLARYGRSRHPDFIVLVRGGLELFQKSRREALLEDPDGARRQPVGGFCSFPMCGRSTVWFWTTRPAAPPWSGNGKRGK